MTKKTLIIFFGFIVLVLFFRSCGEEEEPLMQERSAAVVEETAEKSGSEKKDGLAILADDLTKGEITKEEAFVYRVFSVFRNSDTPKKYRTYIINDYATRLLNAIRLNWETFSPKAKKQLMPYYVSPMDPKSFINQSDGYGKDTDFFVSDAFAQTLPPTNIRKSFVTQNSKIKIWYLPEEEKDAKILLEAFDKDRIYEKETGLMQVHPLPDVNNYIDDEKIDVFFAKYSSSYAFCAVIPYPNFSNKYSSWIGVDNKLLRKTFPKKYKEYMKSSLAHELFHSIQYAIDFGDKTWWWWQEATATWAEHFVYPKVNLEHRWKKLLRSKQWLAGSLTTYDSSVYPGHSYGAYLFPYYMAQQQGADIIGNLWRACEPVGTQILDVIDSQMNKSFEDVFMEFGRWMFNEKPEKYFMDGNKYLLSKPISTTGIYVVAGHNNRPKPYKIEPLGILYEDYRFRDASVKSVDFDFHDLLKNHPDVKIWAMVKQKGQDMESQDWRNVMFKNFCFDIPAENLERVVLIYANCSKKKTVPVSQVLADVTAYKNGCAAKADLTVSLASDANGNVAPSAQAANFFLNMDVKRKESGQATVVFREVLKDKEFPKLGKKLIPFGHFTFTASEESGGSTGFGNMYQTTQTTHLSGSGRDMWKGKHGSEKGFGTISLRVYWPEEEFDIDKEMKKVKDESEDTSTEAQIAKMFAPELSTLMGQVAGMQQQVGGVTQLANEIKKTRPKPQKGQIAYLLEMNVGGVPAEEVKKGKTNRTRKSSIGMKAPVSIYRVVDVEGGSYSFNESGKYGSGTFNVAGTVRINKTLRERKSKEDIE